MYDLWMELEIIPLLTLAILSWMAGGNAAKLLYSGSVERMRRKSIAMLYWAGYVSATGIVVLAAIAVLALSFEPPFWRDRLYIQAPFVAIPMLLVWCLALPRLQALRREAERFTGSPIHPRLRRPSSRCGLIVPYQLTTLGSFTSIYLALVPPAWLHTAIATALSLLVAAGFWRLQHSHSKNAQLPQAKLVYQTQFKQLRRIALAPLTAVSSFIPHSNGLDTDHTQQPDTSPDNTFARGTMMVPSHPAPPSTHDDTSASS